MHIDLTIKNYRCFSDENPARLTVGKRFTAFLGANNSGKSSLLKFFFEFRGLFEASRDLDAFANAMRGKRQAFNVQQTVTDNEEVFHNLNTRAIRIAIHIPRDGPGSGVAPRPDELRFHVARGTNTWQVELIVGGKPLPTIDSWDLVSQEGRIFLRAGSSLHADLTSYLQAVDLLARTLYIGPFRNAINVGTKQDYFDIQVGQAFIRQWRALKTGPRRKDNEAIDTLTEDIRRIFNFDRLEINPTPTDDNLQLFIDRKSYLITEQGAGLAQFVLVLANAAVRRPAYILIDEPELNLHPSLQLDFLTTLASYASEGVLFATHSYGLARSAGNLVYSVRREKGGARVVAPLEATTRLPEFLGELSYGGYTALGFNQVLLVEGPSEVKTVQQFLRQLGKDHEVVLLHLGGSSLIKEDCGTELQEVRRICDNVSALIDSERTDEGAVLDRARSGFQKACQAAGICCHILTRRAMENYFTEAAIQKVKGAGYQALGPYQSLKDLPQRWGKTENWRIAREMSFGDIAATDLGQFLSGL